MSIPIISLEIENDSLKSYGALTLDDAIEIVESKKLLNLTHNEVIGIQRFGVSPRRIDIALKTAAFALESVQRNIDEICKLQNGKKVIISLPNTEQTEVYVKNIPMYWSYERVERIFGYYGIIKKIEHQRIREPDVSNKSYVGKINGVLKVRMTLKKAIPSTLNIDNCRIEIYYKNQVRTCWRCGMGHRKTECNTLYRNFANRFSMDDFPVLKPMNVESQSEHDELSMDQDQPENVEVVEDESHMGEHINAEEVEEELRGGEKDNAEKDFHRGEIIDDGKVEESHTEEEKSNAEQTEGFHRGENKNAEEAE